MNTEKFGGASWADIVGETMGVGEAWRAQILLWMSVGSNEWLKQPQRLGISEALVLRAYGLGFACNFIVELINLKLNTLETVRGTYTSTMFLQYHEPVWQLAQQLELVKLTQTWSLIYHAISITKWEE